MILKFNSGNIRGKGRRGDGGHVLRAPMLRRVVN